MDKHLPVEDSPGQTPVWGATPWYATAFYGAAYLAVYPLMHRISPWGWGVPLVYLCFGIIAASIVLLAFRGALGPQPLLKRIIVLQGTALLLCGCWMTGFVISNGLRFQDDQDTLEGALITLSLLPLSSIAFLSPFYVLRLVFGCRLLPTGDCTKAQTERTSTLGDMMTAIGFIALALAAARMAQPLYLSRNPSIADGGSSAGEFWLDTGLSLVFLAVLTLIGTLPVAMASLSSRRPVLAVASIGILVLGLHALAFAVSLWRFGPPPPEQWNLIGVSTTLVVFLAAVSIPLLIARRRGWRLAWGPR